MSNEKFIHPREPRSDGRHHNHAGKRSHMRGLMSAMEHLADWRRERTAAHERGVDIDSLPDDQEIVLFEPVPLQNSDQFSRPEVDKGVGRSLTPNPLTLGDQIFLVRQQIQQEIRDGKRDG